LQVAIQANGAPASSLLEDLADLRSDPDDGRSPVVVQLVPWGGGDLGVATGKLYELVDVSEHNEDTGMRTGLRHLPAPALEIAAATAVPTVLGGGGIVWDRKRSPADVAPLMAVTAALWLLLRPAAPRKRSVYEDRGVVTVSWVSGPTSCPATVAARPS